MSPFFIVLIVIGGILLAFLIAGFVLACLGAIRKSVWCTDNRKYGAFVTDEKFKEAAPNMQYYVDNGEWIDHKMRDGLTMKAKVFRKEGATKTLVLVHGYRGWPEVDFAFVIGYLKDKNCNVVYIRQRAQTPSEGKVFHMGYKEKDDLHEWIDVIYDMFKTDIYLWGISMGCSTILMSLDKPYGNYLKGIIADCGYTNIFEEYVDIGKKYITFPLSWFVVTCTSLFYRLFTKHGMRKPNTLDCINNTNVPILFIHGDKDSFVNIKHTMKNYEAYKGPKDLLIVKGSDHAIAFIVDPESYKKAVEKMIKF